MCLDKKEKKKKVCDIIDIQILKNADGRTNADW